MKSYTKLEEDFKVLRTAVRNHPAHLSHENSLLKGFSRSGCTDCVIGADATFCSCQLKLKLPSFSGDIFHWQDTDAKAVVHLKI